MLLHSRTPGASLEEKLAFLHETRHAFGRTTLLLSGGASLGSFHVGVVKTLVEHILLPRIIAGSSVGSVMCAVVATRSWPELQISLKIHFIRYKAYDMTGRVLGITLLPLVLFQVFLKLKNSWQQIEVVKLSRITHLSIGALKRPRAVQHADGEMVA
ncbi:hypothetical protein L2E82_41280 [Cichorium intybus]|uniref:Uncharacterized protein n=1 Tax=Cichorium intybus TaxID=13427 RepID=A0ACB9AP71_CICIN|nr:hypothetical protein L2E82_41280 [Cichorium intybus]